MAMVVLEEKEKCCGCGACMNVCPKDAITMQPDKSGFLYPSIDRRICIECGACNKVCAYQNNVKLNTPRKAFVAVNKNEDQLLTSASGGVFSALATKVLKDGGVVFGSSLSFENGQANSHHIAIETTEELFKLQGSKYVQSYIGDTYKQTKKFLLENRKVLFSGTPCQIAGLYSYLKRDYEELITVDIICHGVPNAVFFNRYLQEERDRRKAKSVIGYSFRDKTKGWGMNGRIDFLLKDDSCKSVYIPARLTSYNTLFLDGDIYRENCYLCKYATKNRLSDLTIGDYWGIEVEHPELLGKTGYDEKKGISCILVNTEKGITVCQSMNSLLQLSDSTFEKISHRNEQLKKPSHKSNRRAEIFDIFEADGYPAVEAWFKRKYKKQIIFHAVYNAFPRNIRIRVKRIVGKLKKG